MTAIRGLDLATLLERVDLLQLQNVERIPLDELEWILADFVMSWGQRLSLNPEAWMPTPDRATHRRFGALYLPFATATDFPGVYPDQVRTLGLAAACLVFYVLLLDDIVDEPQTSPAAAKMAIQPLLLHCYRLLSQLFPPHSSFWGEAKRLLNQTSQAMVDEYEIYNGEVRPFSLAEFKRIAKGKMAFMQMNCVGLALLNGTPERIPALCGCWDAIGLTAIVWDDTQDWREDFVRGNYTYLLSQVLLSNPFREEVQAGRLPEPDEVGAALFCTDLIESLYRLACTHLQAAADRAGDITCPALAGMIRHFSETMKTQSVEMSSRKLAAMIAMHTGGSDPAG